MTANSLAGSAQYLRSRMGRVCIAITGATAAEMLAKADDVNRAGSRAGTFLEFRLDLLERPLAAIPQFRDFLYERSDLTAIATCRRIAGGGKFKGSANAQLEILTEASAAGFHLVDLEIETAESLTKAQFSAFRESLAAHNTGLMLSSHDFESTRDLDKTYLRLEPYHPDFMKVVSTAKHLADNIEMMRFLEHRSDRANLVGICMGEQGSVSRVLGVRAGSIFTFAAASEGEETGPGQIAARALLETYRIDQVEASTRVYGVAGNPVRHSLSPIMQNTAFRRETVNAVFLPLETRKLSDLLKLVDELPVHGLAVTMPLKQEILPYLAKTDPLSDRIGACNTVVRSQDGRLFGFNTDVGGITRPLERRLALRGAKVLILGAGGAARAAAFGLVDKGAEVFILNRTHETAQQLARQAKAKAIRRELVAKTHFDVILNATPAGMTGQKLASILEPHELNARIVFDTVYHPIDTPLVRMAREKGTTVITGVEMFVQQGARQFEIWTGKPAPEEEMMRVVVHALRRRGNEAGIGAASSQGTSGATPPAVSDGSRGPFRKTLASVGAKLEEAATPGLRPLRGTDANHARSADSTAKNGPKKLPVPASRKAEKGTKSAPKKAASASIARKGASPARKAPAKTAPVPPAATPKVGRKATGKGKAPRIPPAAKKNTPGKDGRKKSPTSKR